MKNYPNLRANGWVLLIASLLFFSTSCKEEEIAPETVTITPTIPPNDFMESFQIKYYGKETNLWKACYKLAGVYGTVDYEISQSENHEGSDYATLEFTVIPGPTASIDFDYLHFNVLVNMKSRDIRTFYDAFLDGKSLSETDLILLLGGW